MEDKNFDYKNQVQVVEDLSARVSRLSPCDHISNSYSPMVNFLCFQFLQFFALVFLWMLMSIIFICYCFYFSVFFKIVKI